MKYRASLTGVIILFFIMTFHLSGQTYGKRFLLEQKKEEQSQKEQQLPKIESEQRFVLDRAIDPDTYRLGPGDELGISISTDQVVTYNLVVSPSLDLLIPGVGVVDLKQVTLSEAREIISRYIRDAYKNANIGVVISNIRKFKVQIAGAVNNPGFYEITPETRLHEIIEQAEGFHQLAKEMDIQVKRADGEVSKIDYLQYIRRGDLTNDPKFAEGDQIIVPFGNIKTDGVVIRGSITGSGYDIIDTDETLESFLWRRAKFSEDADLESVKITRIVNGKETYMTIYPENFHETILQPGDQIDILGERGVSVIGFVQAPGGYQYFPGYTVSDYIGLAGGNTVEGDANRAMIRHLDGKSERGKDGIVRRGDIIVVPRTRQNILFGNSSILQVTASVFSIMLTYMAATRYK